MVAQRRRDTAPELDLRSAFHRRGLRYHVDRPLLPGLRRKADVSFPRALVAVFVDCCFWHSCPDQRTIPKRNQDWWIRELRANVERDRDTDARPRHAGWHVARAWEHESIEQAADAVERAVRSRHQQNPERPATT